MRVKREVLKERGTRTACTTPETGCHNGMCCNKVCAFYALWKFYAELAREEHKHMGPFNSKVMIWVRKAKANSPDTHPRNN